MAKKTLAIVLAFLFILAALSGCATNNGGSDTTAATTAASAGTTAAATTTAAADTTAAATTTAAADTTAAATTTASAAPDGPEYLNLSTTWPIVKDGYDITIDYYTTYATMRDNWWTLAYWQDKGNFTLNITPIQVDSLAEQKTLLMASGELPDIIAGFGFTPSEIVNYGQVQGLLLDMAPYINADLMPILSQRFVERPDAQQANLLPNGSVYSLPRISSDKNPAYLAVNYWNTEALDKLGIQMPTTLEEAEIALYRFKDEDPYGKGAANLAIANSDSHWMKIQSFFLNAFGFLRGEAGLDLREDKVVYSAADDAFGAYLTFMNKLYQDGIISPDYYTMDTTALKAIAEGGENMFVAGPPYVIMNTGWEKYYGATPLTSEYNSTPQYGITSTTMTGGWVMSADTEYPEMLMRFSDTTFLDEFAVYVYHGPAEGSNEDYYDMFPKGWEINDGLMTFDGMTQTDYQEKYSVTYDICRNQSVGLERNYYLADGYGALALAQHVATGEWEKTVYNMADGDEHYRATSIQNVVPYAKPCLTVGEFYFDEDTSIRVTDLTTLLSEFTKTEVAKFITGNRPLDEFPQFQEQLKSMGCEELAGYYQDYRDGQ